MGQEDFFNAFQEKGPCQSYPSQSKKAPHEGKPGSLTPKANPKWRRSKTMMTDPTTTNRPRKKGGLLLPRKGRKRLLLPKARKNPPAVTFISRMMRKRNLQKSKIRILTNLMTRITRKATKKAKLP